MRHGLGYGSHLHFAVSSMHPCSRSTNERGHARQPDLLHLRLHACLPDRAMTQRSLTHWMLQARRDAEDTAKAAEAKVKADEAKATEAKAKAAEARVWLPSAFCSQQHAPLLTLSQ